MIISLRRSKFYAKSDLNKAHLDKVYRLAELALIVAAVEVVDGGSSPFYLDGRDVLRFLDDDLLVWRAGVLDLV